MKVKLHKYQTLAWKSNAKIIALIAGTGGGKTFFGKYWLLREIINNPGEDFLVISPTYNSFVRVILPEVLGLYLTLLKGNYRAQERILYLKNGSRIFFGSADNPLTLEGVHVKAAWLDEAGQMKREAFEVAVRRTGLKNGRILITTTPYGLNWLKTDIYDRFLEGDPDIFVVQFPSTANPSYPVEEVERAKKTLPSWQFEMFYMGRFKRPEGLVYADFDLKRHLVDPKEIEGRIFAGVDFGFNNPSAVVFVVLDDDDRLFVFDLIYERGLTPNDLINAIKAKDYFEKVEAFYCDPSEPGIIEQMRREGIYAQAAEGRVLQGISRVIQRLKTDRLFIFKGLKPILDEIETYRFKTLGQKDEPVKENDHALDALRYVVMGIDEKSSIFAWLDKDVL